MRGRTEDGKVREIIRGQAIRVMQNQLCGLCFILNAAGSQWRIFGGRGEARVKI